VAEGRRQPIPEDRRVAALPRIGPRAVLPVPANQNYPPFAVRAVRFVAATVLGACIVWLVASLI
jgi:hypothetical protein